VEDEDAMLALLNTELAAIETAIRSLDSIGFQIKGWAVTASLAIGGFAVSNHQAALLLVGGGAIFGFWLVDCQFKTIQRPFILRNRALADDLREFGVAKVLRGLGTVKVLGVPDVFTTRITGWQFSSIHRYIRSILIEATTPSVFGLYTFLLVAMGIEALLL